MRIWLCICLLKQSSKRNPCLGQAAGPRTAKGDRLLSQFSMLFYIQHKKSYSFFPQTWQVATRKLSMTKPSPWLLLLTCLFALFSLSGAGDTLAQGQSISGVEALISAGGTFKLGFFSPGASKNRYLGIWFNNVTGQPVVWVANRESPLTNSTGVLEIGDTGDLILRNETAGIIWSSAPSNASNPVAQLLDSGNLVLRDEQSGSSSYNFVWQSFDYPTDTQLSGMKLGWDSKTGLTRVLRSWSSVDDPSPGNFTYGVDLHGSPQLVLKMGERWVWREGPWNGIQLSGVIDMSTNEGFRFYFESKQDEVYHYYENRNASLLSRVVATPSGVLQTYLWLNQEWKDYWYAPFDQCDNVGECGPYSVCNSNGSPICHCFQGFEPKSPEAWILRDGSGGCVRRTDLDCRKGDGFLNVTRLKLPDTSHSIVNASMSVEECRAVCLRDCSCTAYAPADIRGAGSGCIMWVGDLLDTREYPEGGQSLFLRVASSELDDQTDLTRRYGVKKKPVVVIAIGTVVSAMLLLGCGTCCIWNKKTNNYIKMIPLGSKYHGSSKNNEDLEIPLLDLSMIATATNNFSVENKLGEGGFGVVYKGKLGGGQDIAVKRLSKNSGQGLDEFMNEVMLIAKLQHRNLVRLLGCCIQGEERMLIYEYMHNKSLDTFIFDNTKGLLLNWQKRFDIIMGIARGLLYLHQDSRLKIIHRDLKASNILLDIEMKPKISDFGTARIFGVDQIKDNTKTVVGTYGYMSPEYVINGIFSTKSDVFSFGVQVLEIVSGKRNRGLYQPELNLTLLGYAWRLWNEGNSLKLLDEAIPSCNITEVLRCIQVGLLCVQERAVDRPEMASVVIMLGGNVMLLPPPKRPGFCTEISSNHYEWSCNGKESSSTSDLTITALKGR